MSLTRVWIPSPCYSSRGADVRLIVIHSSEGAQTLESLGSWFGNGANQVSSHTGIDDVQRGRIGEYVKPGNKAWTAASANPYAIQTELCTPNGASANWSRQTWLDHGTMLANCADWIAEEAARFGIPITRLTPSQAQGGASGVCQHADLGAMGGGHVDCGSQFPIDDVIAMATGTPTTEEGAEMIASGKNNGGTPHVFWVGSNPQEIYYRWQADGKWQGGRLFATAPKSIDGLSCTTDAGGHFNVFAHMVDGNVRYTWQPKGKNDWNGDSSSAPAGLIAFP